MAEIAVVPEGWKLVPKEPVREMLGVSVPQPMTVKGSETDTIRWHLYTAMIAASPPAPSMGVTLPSEEEIDALIVQHTGAGCERCGDRKQVSGTYEAARAILNLIERKKGRKR